MNPPSKTPFTLRHARSEDAKEIVELGRSVNMTTFGKFVRDEGFYREYLEGAYTVEKVVGDIEDPKKDFILATTTPEETKAEEKVIGFATLVRGNSYPFLEHLEAIVELGRIYIYPEFHGRGVGKALMGRLEDIARREGKKNMWLGCYEHNEVARKVYEKAGFMRVGERSNSIGGEEYWDVVMVKGL